MWVGAGAAGSKRGGLGRPELQAPQGQGGGPAEDGSDRAGRGRAREEGRMAWGLGGRVPLGREGGRERDRPGRGKRGKRREQPATVWPRGEPGPRGAEYPAASSRRKRLSLSPWQSTLERTAAQQGRDKALAALRPAARQRPPAAQGAQLPFYPGGDLSSSCPANFPSGGRTGCVPGHTHPHL